MAAYNQQATYPQTAAELALGSSTNGKFLVLEFPTFTGTMDAAGQSLRLQILPGEPHDVTGWPDWQRLGPIDVFFTNQYGTQANVTQTTTPYEPFIARLDMRREGNRQLSTEATAKTQITYWLTPTTANINSLNNIHGAPGAGKFWVTLVPRHTQTFYASASFVGTYT